MIRWRVALVTGLLMLAAALPASAAKVGLATGDSDPIPITDPTWQPLLESECITPILLPSTYRCARYDAVDPINSIDFRLKDGTGALIPFPDSIFVDQFSALLILTVSPIFPDGVTFRLSAFGPDLVCATCIFFSDHNNGAADPAFVQIVAVNDVINVLPVPEPATLLLAGPAAAWVLRRRRRTRG